MAYLKNRDRKGVFCLEGLSGICPISGRGVDLSERLSVEPALIMFQKCSGVKFVWNQCLTVSSLEYGLKKSTLKKYSKYPIIYLSFHGKNGRIVLADGEVDLMRIAEIMEKRCYGKIVVVSSCNTLDVDSSIISAFLDTTKSLAICGYLDTTNWLKSALFEIMLFDVLQKYEYSKRGMRGIKKKVDEMLNGFNDLYFKIFY